jgi:hypothetical protein
MKSFVNYLFVAASALLLFACKKSTISTYSGMDAVYFNNTADSSKITFAYDVLSKTDSIIKVRVNTTGPVADHDREFKLTFIDSNTTAKKDVNYTLLTDKLVIKAGEVFTSLSFKLYRTSDLVSKTYLINLLLEPNDNFTTDYSWEWVSLNLKTWRPLLRYTITFDDIFSQPKNWQVAFFGTFSRTKLNLVSAFFEIDLANCNIQSGGAYSATTWGVFAKVFQRYLNDEAAAGRTIYDEDGKPMILGKDAQ